MKKVNKIFNIVFVWIACIVAISMTMTFVSDYLISINWFGDHVRLHPEKWQDINAWGARHYWYNYSAVLFVLLSTIRLIVSIATISKETK